jgi:hypothetical protein
VSSDRVTGVLGALCCILLLIAFIAGSRARGRQRERILRTGASAQAVVLQLENQGFSSSSGMTHAKFDLQVRPEGTPPYRVKAYLDVPVGDVKLLYSLGQTLKVFVDPDDPQQVEIPDPARLTPP